MSALAGPSRLRPHLLLDVAGAVRAQRPAERLLVLPGRAAGACRHAGLSLAPSHRRSFGTRALRVSPATRKRVTDLSFGAVFLFACLTVSLVRRRAVRCE